LNQFFGFKLRCFFLDCLVIFSFYSRFICNRVFELVLEILFKLLIKLVFWQIALSPMDMIDDASILLELLFDLLTNFGGLSKLVHSVFEEKLSDFGARHFEKQSECESELP
jgi:hypothetical protein